MFPCQRTLIPSLDKVIRFSLSLYKKLVVPAVVQVIAPVALTPIVVFRSLTIHCS